MSAPRQALPLADRLRHLPGDLECLRLGRADLIEAQDAVRGHHRRPDHWFSEMRDGLDALTLAVRLARLAAADPARFLAELER